MRARTVVVPTQFLAESLRHAFENINVVMIRNGVNDKIFRPTTVTERYTYRQQLNIPPDVKLIGYVGQIANNKGLQVLQLFCQILSSDIHFIIRTRQKPQYMEALTNLLSINRERVHFDLEKEDSAR